MKVINIVVLLVIFYIGYEYGTYRELSEQQQVQMKRNALDRQITTEKKKTTDHQAERLENDLDELNAIGRKHDKYSQQGTEKSRSNDDYLCINHLDFSVFIKQNDKYEQLLSSESNEKMQQ